MITSRQPTSADGHATPSYADRLALLVLGTSQALLLVLLWRADASSTWPATDARWFDAFRSVVIGVPFFLLLAASHWRDRWNLYAGVGAAGVLFALGWHFGWLVGDDEYGRAGFEWALGCSAAIAMFIGAFLLRTRRIRGRLEYQGLLDTSWRNALVLAFLALFLLVFWMLLMLWAELFALIGIKFFRELFDDDGVNRILFGIAGGWGAGLILSRVGLVTSVRHLCELLTRTLLPLVSLILLVFLAALAFTGVETLFDTGHTASLLLWLTAVLLFFFNAVLTDEADAFTRIRWLSRFVLVAVVVLPVVVAIAAWALALRIDQYGLTVARLWGVFVAFFLGAFSVGYAFVIIRDRGRLHLAPLHRLNTLIAATLAAALCLVNLPPLDFHRLAADALVKRLEVGITAVDDFDAVYLRFGLGEYGRQRLAELRASNLAEADPRLRDRLDEALSAEHRYVPARHADGDALQGRLTLAPGVTVDDRFLDALAFDDGCPVERETECLVADLTLPDVAPLRVVANAYDDSGMLYAITLWWRHDGEWRQAGEAHRVDCAAPTAEADQWPVLVERRFDVFRLGRCRFQFGPNAEFIDSLDAP